jgi:alkanesulfonate monooxygenase SsuD/methylene tetrahydromethanopterin reductase-like flavin-dependent oxidoreductase (luciferase family)
VVVSPLYDPARLLAEIGMVDCLSEGRLVLGVGSGYQPYEFERFGKDSRSAGDFDVPALQGTYFTRKVSLK